MLAAIATLLLASSPVSAQTVAPSKVTPRDIAPPPPPPAARVLKEPEFLQQAAPADSSLAIDTGDARIEGAFPDLALANTAFIARVAHQHIALPQLLTAARELEQAYARHGYILVRVSVPPQRLEQGGPVRVVVIDGFIEDIDTSHLAAPLRAAVKNRVRSLVGQRHITQATIERALLLAGDLAGARLRSAVAPGTAIGGVRLVIEGRYVRIEGQTSADNGLPASLGRWQINGNLALNGVLRAGDQIYLSAGSEADIGRYGFPKAGLAMLGGGYIVPIHDNGMTLTGEFLTSRTQPKPVPSAPRSVGDFTRERLSINLPVIRERSETLSFNSAYEIITQSEKLPQFATQSSRDHYLALQLGMNWQRELWRVPVSLNSVLTRGLAGRDATHALPTSRQGASPDFTNFEGTARATLPAPGKFILDLTARGKTNFRKPQFISEQFALDAPNAVSAFASGSFDVDSGVTVRGELCSPPWTLRPSLTMAPYIFGAKGWGWLQRPSGVEQGYVTIGAIGVGERIGIATIPWLRGTRATAGIEFGHQFTDVSGRKNGQRVSLSTAFRF